MKKLLLYDLNNSPIYLSDLVEIDNLIYKIYSVNNEIYFYREGAGWGFDLNKIKIRKVKKKIDIRKVMV